MRFGFASIYAWRPHVEHMHFLAQLAKKAGHEVSFLTCDADLERCYTKVFRRERSDFIQCATCRLGGLRSYEASNVYAIGTLAFEHQAYPDDLASWGKSSVSTIVRYESDSDFASPSFEQHSAEFIGSLRKTYSATSKWIEANDLDGICVFNGRMDVTRAILEAAKKLNVPFLSLERTLFGDGVQLLPNESCLGLQSVNRLVDTWKDKPLSFEQAKMAAGHVAKRFLRSNHKEWRAYNSEAIDTPWPVGTGEHKILLVPSSRNEVWGHPDWTSGWGEVINAYDALIGHLNLKSTDLVLRCHPNWGERIGSVDGSRIENYFLRWAQDRGVAVVPSTNKSSTLNLISQCDAIVVNGGSAGLEAAILGKQVIAASPSIYQNAGFQTTFTSASDLSDLKLTKSMSAISRNSHARHTQRQLLRFIYTMAYRIPQFVNQIRCETTTRYSYADGANPQRLIDLFKTGELQADDATFASDQQGEDAVLALIDDRAWSTLGKMPPAEAKTIQKIQRRLMFRPVDHVRNMFKRGDL
jgi:hypothetical protein